MGFVTNLFTTHATKNIYRVSRFLCQDHGNISWNWPASSISVLLYFYICVENSWLMWFFVSHEIGAIGGGSGWQHQQSVFIFIVKCQQLHKYTFDAGTFKWSYYKCMIKRQTTNDYVKFQIIETCLNITQPHLDCYPPKITILKLKFKSSRLCGLAAVARVTVTRTNYKVQQTVFTSQFGAIHFYPSHCTLQWMGGGLMGFWSEGIQRSTSKNWYKNGPQISKLNDYCVKDCFFPM